MAAKLIIKLATKVCSWNFEKYRIQSNNYMQSFGRKNMASNKTH